MAKAGWCRLGAITLWLAALLAVSSSSPACTNVLVTPGATAAGSSFVTYSCDGGVFAALNVVAGEIHAGDSAIDVFGDPLYAAGVPGAPPARLGRLPQVEITYRYVDVRGGADLYHIGGVNEHGVAIAETTLVGTRPELRSDRGLLAPFSACAARSLMSLALARATTAREAVRVIGQLAERYGYSSPFPIDGEQFAISDGTEVWSMEIFGPGRQWTPDCGRPGAVWCAQRVPDGHVAVSANRSRIAEINLENRDAFLASTNVYSVAIEMGWWNPSSGRPFVWRDAYAPSDRWGSAVREWRVLSLVAPSHGLDPGGELPFSVRAERSLSTADVMAIQRDLLEGTPYDAVAEPAFVTATGTSPLATPQGAPALYELLSIAPDRTISNRYASFSCVYETSLARPAAMRGCAWFGFGPAATSCYVPIYSGTSAIAERWSQADLAGDFSLPFWTMTLPGQLVTTRWQTGFPDLAAVRSAAESAFLAEESVLASRLASEPDGGAAWLAALTAARMDAVERAFVALGDYLRLSCLTEIADRVHLALPTVSVPTLNDVP